MPELSLRPHQVVASTQFVKQCFCSGMLLYHRMGTGKTATVLATLMNYPGQPILLIHPVGLEAQWVSEIDKYFVREPRFKNTFQIEFMSYDAFFTTLSKEEVAAAVGRAHIIVADEAQKISMQKLTPSMSPERADRIQFARNILSTRRCILVTGTPIDNNIADLAVLVNIAARRQVLPYDPKQFMDKFGSTRPLAAVASYVAPIMFTAGCFLMIATVVGLPNFLQGFQSVFEDGTSGMYARVGERQEQIVETLGRWKDTMQTSGLSFTTVNTAEGGRDVFFTPTGTEVSTSLRNTTLEHVSQEDAEAIMMNYAVASDLGKKKVQVILNALRSMTGKPLPILGDVASGAMSLSKTYLSEPLLAGLRQLLDPNTFALLKTNPITVTLSDTAKITSEQSQWDLLLFPLMLLLVTGTMYALYGSYTRGKVKYINAAKLYVTVKDYMTFFDYLYDSTGEAQRSFPELNLVKTTFAYDKVQTELFVRFITGRVTRADLVALNMVSGPQDWEGLRNETSLDKFLNNGRLIANVSLDELNAAQWKNGVRFEVDDTSRAIFAVVSESVPFNYFHSIKFWELLQMIRRDVAAGFRVVVYSSFRRTFQNVSVYLSHHGMQHLKMNASDPRDVIIRVQDTFRDRSAPYNVLLLDPLLTEGINLEAAKRLHVLEPISNWGQQEQVYARVLRQLPQPVAVGEKRPVSVVYQWVETLPGVVTMAKRVVQLAFGDRLPGIFQQTGLTPADVSAWAFGSRASMFVQNDASDFNAWFATKYPSTATPGQLTQDNLHDIAEVMGKLQQQLAMTKPGDAVCTANTPRDCSIWMSLTDPGTCQSSAPGDCGGDQDAAAQQPAVAADAAAAEAKSRGRTALETIYGGAAPQHNIGYCTSSAIVNSFLGMMRI